MYKIQLFGGLSATDSAGASISQFRTRKAALLLAYLALHPTRKHSREELTDRFWTELAPEAGRDNLSTCLTTLRRHFKNTRNTTAMPPVFLANWEYVWLNTEAVSVDVMLFEQNLDRAVATRNNIRRRELLESAIALYQGALLTGIYEDWALAERDRLAERFVQALIALAEVQRVTTSEEAALSTARHAQHLDPYNESVCLLRMRLLAAQGRIRAAHDAYNEFTALLKEDLDASPSPALTQSLRQITEQKSSLYFAEKEVAPLPDMAPDSSFALESMLKSPLCITPLRGRDAEQERLIRLLTSPGCSRLVTITGVGGIGKTSLALAAATKLLLPTVPIRTRWVSLADVSCANQVLPAIARVLGVQHSDAMEAIRVALPPPPDGERILLVLDNVEQLLPRHNKQYQEGEQSEQLSLPRLLHVLLYRVPHLQLLCTSRRTLGMHGEQEFPLGALSESYATQLFIECLERVRPGEYRERNTNSVSRIVQRVEGIPLALEMVAGWSRTLTLDQIARRLSGTGNRERSEPLNLLVNRSKDVPTRHQSLRKTLLWSLEMLPPSVQQVFAELSVFQGGWTVEAVEAILGENALNCLQELVEHSLITTTSLWLGEDEKNGEQRQRFLEPIRELSCELLRQWGRSDADQVKHRHTNYFTQRLRDASHSWYRAESANCHAAINRLIDQAGKTTIDTPCTASNTPTEVAESVEAYVNHLVAAGAQREAWEVIRRLLATVSDIPAYNRTQLLLRLVTCCWALHRQGEIGAILNEAEEEAVRAGDRHTLAIVRAQWGNYHHGHGRAAEAVAVTEKVIDEFPDIFGAGAPDARWIRGNLAAFMTTARQYDRAEAIFSKNLTLLQQEGNRGGMIVCLFNLSEVHSERGNFTCAVDYTRQAVEIASEFNELGMILFGIFRFAALSIAVGNWDKGARLEAAGVMLAKSDAEKRRVPISPYYTLEYHLCRHGDWRARFSLQELRHLEQEGQSMSLEVAARYALTNSF